MIAQGFLLPTRRYASVGISDPSVVGGRRPISREICAQSDPPPPEHTFSTNIYS